MNFDKVNQLLNRSLKVSPLGAQTFSKSYRYYIKNHAPMFLERGDGCYVWDVDGNRFTDWICALGPITVGYNNKYVNNAVTEQLGKGIIFSTQTPVEVELAEKLISIIPCAEMVRFVKNGGDATTAAVRLARAFTGRDRVAMCGYHGMHDWSIGASPNNRGVPAGVSGLTTNFLYNDLTSLQVVLESHRNEFAAVIMEPIQANGTTSEYLTSVKNLAHKHGALLIFDEVVSGFRYALGGASEFYNVVPDLAAFGKGMGNGLPISAVAGKKEIMALIEEGVFISTTFGGDALSMAGALATIKQLEERDAYKHFWKIGSLIKEGLNGLIAKNGISDVVSVSGLAPHCGVSFEGSGKLNYLDINSIYSYYMIQRGMLVLAINNVNLSHTEKDVAEFLAAADEAFKMIGVAKERDSLKGIVPEDCTVSPVFTRNIK